MRTGWSRSVFSRRRTIFSLQELSPAIRAPATTLCDAVPDVYVIQRCASSSSSSARAPPPPPPPPPLPGLAHCRGAAPGSGRGAPTPSAARSGPRLPPPPPLGGLRAAALAGQSVVPWRSPHEVLSALVEYVPTFFVPVHCVTAVMPEDLRECFIGRNKFLMFLRRYPFFFQLRVLDGGARNDVRLREDVSHPQRGAADEKYMLTDVGEHANYVAKPEFIVSMDSIEAYSHSVALHPQAAPPSVRVQLEERVPALDRLRSLIPASFTPMAVLEEQLPEDLLFHPYFDCQGGLPSIAGKFPELFQVVDGSIRLRPPHLAPLALNEHTLDTSPLPDVAELVRVAVCDSDIPHWVSITPLYEQLTRDQKQAVKRGFKSFAGFLRAHGRSLSVSHDMLQVSMWICPAHATAAATSAATSAASSGGGGEPHSAASVSQSECISSPSSLPHSSHPTTDAVPPERQHIAPATTTPSSSAVAADEVGVGVRATARSAASEGAEAPAPPASATRYIYTHTQVLNELYERFPPGRTLNLSEALELLPAEMRAFSLPNRVAPWLSTFPAYFVVENPAEKDPAHVYIRRASDRQPLDYVTLLYPHIPGDGITEHALLSCLSPSQREMLTRVKLPDVVRMLPDWLALEESGTVEGGTGVIVKRLQSQEAIQLALRREQGDREQRRQRAPVPLEDAVLGAVEPLHYEGGMSPTPLRASHRGSGL